MVGSGTLRDANRPIIFHITRLRDVSKETQTDKNNRNGGKKLIKKGKRSVESVWQKAALRDNCNPFG